MRLRIGPKVLLTMLGVGAPSLLLFSALVLHSRSEILQANIIRQLEDLALLSTRTVQDLVDHSQEALLAIAASPDVAELVAGRKAGDRERVARAIEELETTFLDFQNLDRTIQAIRFIDQDGYVLVKAREGKIIPREGPLVPSLGVRAVSTKAERDFFQNALRLGPGEVWVSNLERGWMEGEEHWCPAMVRFATPLFTADGERAGVVLINVWGKALGTMINRLIAPEEGTAFIIERNGSDPEREGIYLFHPARNCEFGNQTGSRITVFQDFPESVTGGWMGQAQGINQHPETGDILVHRYFSPYGQGDRGWVIVVNARREIFMAPLAVMKSRILLSAGAVLALMILAALFFARTLTRPLRAVIDGTHLISRDLSRRIDIRSRDEIGLLAGEINEMAATLEDNLAEKKRIEEQICQSEKLASVGEMAAGLAHELNTPLSNIKALAALARKDLEQGHAEPAALQEDLGVIIEQTGKCSRIISGLLGFARRQQTEVALHDLNAIVENAAGLVRIRSEKKGVAVEFRPNDRLPHIKVDGHQLEQVCVNLLLNAVDATGAGGRITVRSEFTGTFVRLHVADTGCGIPPEIQARIFDPFFTTKEVGKGTGLGLSLSYGFIRNHGGTIEVRSEVGAGSEFTILLPAGHQETLHV